MRKKVANFVDGDAATFAFTHVAQARANWMSPWPTKSVICCSARSTRSSTSTAVTTWRSPRLQGQYSSGMVKDFNGFPLIPPLT
jgi:hypothetical protein